MVYRCQFIGKMNFSKEFTILKSILVNGIYIFTNSNRFQFLTIRKCIFSYLLHRGRNGIAFLSATAHLD